MFLEKLANGQFLFGGISNPGISIISQFQRRHVSIAFLFVSLKCNRPIPFLPTHGQELFG
ncbi:MAG: hypothetical protein DMF03_13500 [Verrucomicrobia bacterium]|nr:MAG: hypothetical protein DMF03_13500 [Verrucomicrobiota bacterium]